MRKFLTLGVSASYTDPALIEKQQKQLYANVANTGTVTVGIPTTTLSASVNQTVKTRTIQTIYSGVACDVSLTINGTTYQKRCYSYHSCVHIDLNDILGNDNFIDIMLCSWNAYFTYKINKDVTINSVDYRFNSTKNTRLKAQYYNMPKSFQISEVGNNCSIQKLVYNEKTKLYLGRGYSPDIANTACMIYRSTDGLNWTQSVLDCPLTTELPSIDVLYKARTYQTMEAVGNGFVILSSASRIDNEYCNMYHYTEDGINWKSGPLPRPSGSTNRNIYDGIIQEIDGKYIVVGTGKTTKSTQINGAWTATGITETNWSVYTTNGYTWSLINFPVSYKWNEKIKKFKSKYFLTASTGIQSGDNYNLCVMSSSDLVNWSAHTLVCGTALSACSAPMACTDNMALIVNTASNRNGKTDYIYFYSSDGITWTKKNTPNYSNYSRFLAAQAIHNTFVLMETSRGTSGLIVYYSTDAVNWTKTTVPGTATSSGSYSVSDPLYITNGIIYITQNITIDGTSRRCMCYSKDGISWALTTLPCSANGQMQYYKGLWLWGDTTSSFENRMMYSYDGTYWTKVPMLAKYEFLGWRYLGNRWFLYNDYRQTDLPACIVSFKDTLNDYIVPINEPSSDFNCDAFMYTPDNSANGQITVIYTLGSNITKLLVQVNNGEIQDLTSSKSITVNKGDTLISSCYLGTGSAYWNGWEKPNPYTSNNAGWTSPSGPPRYWSYTIPVDANKSVMELCATTTLGGGSGNLTPI